MGPVEIEVENAEWRALDGRRLRLAQGPAPTVTIVNNGPHVEPFFVRIEGVAGELSLRLQPYTTSRATWRKGAGWQQVTQPAAQHGPAVAAPDSVDD
jgi:hypothetical protein